MIAFAFTFRFPAGMIFRLAVFCVVSAGLTGSTRLDPNRVPSVRVMLETLGRLVDNIFEKRDEIQLMAIESSQERKVLDRATFSAHVDGYLTSDERLIRRSLLALDHMDATGTRFRTALIDLSTNFSPVVADLQRIYVALPVETLTLVKAHNTLKLLIRDCLFFSLSFSSIIYPSRYPSTVAAVHPALLLLQAVWPALSGSLRAIHLDWPQGSDERKYVDSHEGLQDLSTRLLLDLPSIEWRVGNHVANVRSNFQQVEQDIRSLISDCRNLQRDVQVLIDMLPKTLLVGPKKLVHVRRGLELRDIEIDLVRTTLTSYNT